LIFQSTTPGKYLVEALVVFSWNSEQMDDKLFCTFRSGHRWELKQVLNRKRGRGLIDLAEERGKWQAFVNMVMNFQVP
jgi:hypothetical protein